MIKSLAQILFNIKYELISGSVDVDITGISFDSRKTENGHLFVAVDGSNVDGHKYINDAIENGAVAVLIQNNVYAVENITVLKTEDSSYSLGVIASSFYENPSSKLKLIGITGTNGKTTTATLLYKLFVSFGKKAGLISTVSNFINSKEYKADYTTPDAVSFNFLLNKMAEDGCEYCFAEVSSHSIHQNRIAGLTFAGGIFTNLTHDHLDYHKTFSEYLNVKKQFFDSLHQNAFVLTNIDDKNGQIIIQNTQAKKYSYGVKAFADFKTKIIESHIDGMLLNTEGKEYWTFLTGSFNAYNLTAVYAIAGILDFEEDEILRNMSNLKSVKGRFDTVKINNITAVVDYAHSPDALKNVLRTINEIRKPEQELITVLGAGGNRDKLKRPVMAEIAVTESSKVILTSDNPRFEDPESIIEDMYEGVKHMKKQIIKITDRKEAIKTAVILAKKGDIILIAGKGHENYQEVKGIRKHFDDKETVQEFLNYDV